MHCLRSELRRSDGQEMMGGSWLSMADLLMDGVSALPQPVKVLKTSHDGTGTGIIFHDPPKK